VSNANAPCVTKRKSSSPLRMALLGGACLLAANGLAIAAPSDDGSLTWNGITVYGVVDIGVQYDSNGAPVSDYFPAGGTGLLQKNSRESIFAVSPSNLGQSKLGIKGSEPLIGDWSGVFKLETFFNPQSGDISDALKSLTLNNGKPATAQTTGVDSSIAGQTFNSAAFAGLSSPTFGTITFGRQTGLLADGVGKYDPQGSSNSFSVIGFSGTAAGGGDTENRRLDSSVKYVGQFGRIHAGAMYQFNGSSGTVGNALQLQLGFDFAGASVDAYYAKKNDAIAVSSLSAAQLGELSCIAPACISPTGNYSYSASNSLTATISDNTTYSVMGSYTFGAPKVFAGYEHISYANPSTGLTAGMTTIGGYVLAFVNNKAFPNNKVLQVGWVGAKFAVSPMFDVTGAWYHYSQNAYGSGAEAGCSTDAHGVCSGSLDAASVVADWRLSKRFDMYAGAMWTSVKNGLANGYIKTSNVDPTIGVRFTF
jgi:predicted porin